MQDPDDDPDTLRTNLDELPRDKLETLLEDLWDRSKRHEYHATGLAQRLVAEADKPDGHNAPLALGEELLDELDAWTTLAQRHTQVHEELTRRRDGNGPRQGVG